MNATQTNVPGIVLMGDALATDVGVMNITADMTIYKSGSSELL